jgi:hypothetical protein
MKPNRSKVTSKSSAFSSTSIAPSIVDSPIVGKFHNGLIVDSNEEGDYRWLEAKIGPPIPNRGFHALNCLAARRVNLGWMLLVVVS